MARNSDDVVYISDSTVPLTTAIASSGTVTSVTSANGNLTVSSPTTTPNLTVVAAPKLNPGNTINGVLFDGSAAITIPVGTGTVTSVASADGSITVTNPTTTVDLKVVKATTGFTVSGGNSVLEGDNRTFTIGTTPNYFTIQRDPSSGILLFNNTTQPGNRGYQFHNAENFVVDDDDSIRLTIQTITNNKAAGVRFIARDTGDYSWYIDNRGGLDAPNNRLAFVSDATEVFTLSASGPIITGTWNATAIGAAYGGTGQTSYAVGDLLYASGATALSKLADVATGNALISGGITTAPSWGKIGLTTHISGTLGVGNGGTGMASYAVGDLLYASGAAALSALADVAAGSYLRSGGVTTAPVWSTLVLPNSATSTRVPYATGTNVWGESASLTFDGTKLTVGSTPMFSPSDTCQFYGSGSAASRSSGSNQIGIGKGTFGSGVLTGDSLIAIGLTAARDNTSGNDSIYIGTFAGRAVTTAFLNVAIGNSAMRGDSGAVTAGPNVAIGNSSLLNLTSGDYNVCIGYQAGKGITTGTQNMLFGANCGISLTTQGNNTMIGGSTGQNCTGSTNIFIGASAGFTATSVSGSVFIGYQAGYSETTSNKLYIANTSTATPLIWGDFSTPTIRVYGRIGALKTTEQMRLEYDASNYFSTTVASTGSTTFALTGTTPTFTFSQGVTFSDDITMANAKNIIVNATTGTKIGTASSQKLGFWNAAPIVQPTTGVAAAAFVANTSGIVDDSATFGGYTIGQVVAALKNIGLLA